MFGVDVARVECDGFPYTWAYNILLLFQSMLPTISKNIKFHFATRRSEILSLAKASILGNRYQDFSPCPVPPNQYGPALPGPSQSIWDAADRKTTMIPVSDKGCSYSSMKE